MSQEQQEQVLQNSEPQSVDVTVNVGGDSRAERFLGTFDQISRLSLDIDRNYGNKRVLTDFPLEHDGSKWTGTINKLIVGFDYTITGHAFKAYKAQLMSKHTHKQEFRNHFWFSKEGDVADNIENGSEVKFLCDDKEYGPFTIEGLNLNDGTNMLSDDTSHQAQEFL